MIPVAHITQWRNVAPWMDDAQVEQDLILSRILVEIFSDPFLNQALAFRGGTALHKLFFDPPARYSEDIDLVRTDFGQISDIVNRLRLRLDPWLGEAATDRKKHSFKLIYKLQAENGTRMRVKIEINTREHQHCFKRLQKRFTVQSAWFSGEAYINTYHLDELIATKLRALYQRKKGRDVFDIWLALEKNHMDVERVIEAFHFYMEKNEDIITQTAFVKNLDEKLRKQAFIDDIGPLLSPEYQKTRSGRMLMEDGNSLLLENGDFFMTEGWTVEEAVEVIKNKILVKLI